MNKGGITIFFIILIFFSLSASIYAGGKREDRLPEAKQLIEEKKYSEAIKVLADIIKHNPEKLDEAEVLMSRIRSARNQYNAKYASLVELIKKENLTDDDITEAYNLISEMEELDAAPDVSITGSFDSARRSIVFRYNDFLFQDVMDRALALIEQKRYWDALALYPEALGLHREIFEEDYQVEEVSEADARISGIRENIAALLSYRQGYVQGAEKALIESENNVYNPARVVEYSDFINVTANMAVFREASRENAVYLEEKRTSLLSPGEYDIPYLSAANRVITGRRTAADAGVQEGVLYAVKALWEDSTGEARTRLTEKSEKEFNDGTGFFNSGNFQEAEESFTRSSFYNSIEKRLMLLKKHTLSPLPPPDITDEELALLFQDDPDFHNSDKFLKASEDYAVLSGIMLGSEEVRAVFRQAESAAVVADLRGRIESSADTAEEGLEEWNQVTENLEQLASLGVDTAAAKETASTMNNVFTYTLSNLDSLVIEIARAGIDLRYNPVSEILEEQKIEIANAVEFVEGVEQAIGTGEEAFTITAKYPQDARNILENSKTVLAAAERDFRAVEQLIVVEESDLSEEILIAEALTLTRRDIAEIARLNTIADNYLLRSRELITQSEIFRNQGNRHLDEARALLARAAFTESRERVQQARESFRNSLLNSEDQQLRDFTDRELLAISEEIITRQTIVVIETVRRNIVQARDLYLRERFGDAENLLINSQTLWNTVNTQDNPEIEYWLGLVQTALSVRTGRFFAETDPLFNEMTQVLNLARNDYQNALMAQQQGRRDEMLRHVESAEEKLLYISIPFPLNQEASILSLRLLRLKDEANFNVLFRERFDIARQRVDVNPSEAYISLKDLEAINPAYPGMAQAVYRAEINLGIRTPPPDPARLRQAEELYQRALAIFQTNIRSTFPAAIDLLNQAFELNPDNQNITALKDRLQTMIGGTTTVVLSSYAQEQYRLAEQEFINGNYFASLAIVNRLLLDERNKNYSPLIELKRRIDSRI